MLCLKTIMAVTLISLCTYDMVTTESRGGTHQDVPILPPIPSNYHCLSNDDCNTNQCCYKVPKYPIMSKRFLEPLTSTPRPFGPFGDYYIGSKCYNYVGEGVFCGYAHCGCLGHKSCQLVPISTTPMPLLSTISMAQRARRTPLPMFPGYDYRCV